MKPELLVYGNSHVRYLLGGHGRTFKEHEKFTCRGKQLGSTGSTVWGLNNHASKTGAGPDLIRTIKEEADAKADVTSKLRLVLCFGEVDVRAHVLKHSVMSQRDTTDVVWELVYRYERWLLENIVDYTGDRLCLLGTVPYTRMFFSTHHPSRKLLTGYIQGAFNAAISGICRENDWTYLDVYDGLVDDEGFLLDEFAYDPLAVDDIHLHSDRTAEHLRPQLERYLASR